jgi:hypothetical protein
MCIRTISRRAICALILSLTACDEGSPARELGAPHDQSVAETRSGDRAASDRSVDRAKDATTVGRFPLTVAAGGRTLQGADSKPFLIHGDTAWSVIVQLKQTEAELYLDTRHQQGFNTIVVNLLEAHFSSAPPKNAYGAAPFTTTGDLSTPNPAYFQHVDWFLAAAQKRDVLVLLNPLYLGYTTSGGPSDEGWADTVAKNGTTKCRDFGRYIGDRYKGFPNIIWVAGGDQTVASGSAYEKGTLEVMAGIKEKASQLWTAHWARGKNAREVASFSTFLQLDAVYTGLLTYEGSKRAYQTSPAWPHFLYEGYYEGCYPGAGCTATADEVRAQAYWANLSGSTGQVFGSHEIWDFSPSRDWKTALTAKGSTQMGVLLGAFASRRWQALVPDWGHTVVTSGTGSFGAKDYVTAAATADGELLMAYLPCTGTASRTVTVALGKLGVTTTGRWLNPTTGQTSSVAGSPFAPSGSKTLTSPGDNGSGCNDWLLILEK